MAELIVFFIEVIHGSASGVAYCAFIVAFQRAGIAERSFPVRSINRLPKWIESLMLLDFDYWFTRMTAIVLVCRPGFLFIFLVSRLNEGTERTHAFADARTNQLGYVRWNSKVLPNLLLHLSTTQSCKLRPWWYKNISAHGRRIKELVGHSFQNFDWQDPTQTFLQILLVSD